MFEFKNKKSSFFPTFLLVLLSLNSWLIMFPNACSCKNLSKPIIVINPGHGGHDLGASGIDGTLEKNISLTLANLIVKNLKNKYRPILTRTGDYFLNIPKRTSIANNSKASLFVCIHANGSYGYKNNGITISYLKKSSDFASFSHEPPLKDINESYSHTPWDNIHKSQIKKSIEVGKSIQERLTENKKFPGNRLMGSPLRVLSGADMPAVMIEIGYLSNPIEEKKLRNIEYLSDLAREIYNGIDDFYSKTETNPDQ